MTGPGRGTAGRIFLSYRRDDTAAYAGRLLDRLRDRVGRGQVFMDVDSLEPGVDFVEAIERAVASCQVFVALIGPAWLKADTRGRRRLDDPHDIVRLELQAAASRDVPIIPVLTDDAAPPRAEDLPPGLATLARRNYVRLTHERFRTDTEQLLDVVAHAAERPGRGRPAPEAP